MAMKTRATTILAALAALTSTNATNISSEINWGQEFRYRLRADNHRNRALTMSIRSLPPPACGSISARVTGHKLPD